MPLKPTQDCFASIARLWGIHRSDMCSAESRCYDKNNAISASELLLVGYPKQKTWRNTSASLVNMNKSSSSVLLTALKTYAAKEQILKQDDCHYTLTLYISVTAHYIYIYFKYYKTWPTDCVWREGLSDSRAAETHLSPDDDVFPKLASKQRACKDETI